MPTPHIVSQGECLSSIAKLYGFADWRRIYNAPDNEAFRKKRPNPDVIYPGDVVQIPARDQTPLVLATGRRHKIIVKRVQTRVRLQLEIDEAHAYELEAAGRKIEGQTDGSFPIECSVPADLAEATITVWPVSGDRSQSMKWTLKLGHL